MNQKQVIDMYDEDGLSELILILLNNGYSVTVCKDEDAFGDEFYKIIYRKPKAKAGVE